MKSLTIFLILALACHFTCAGKTHQFKVDAVRQRGEKAFGGKIKDALNKFKETMKTGNEAAGLPVLEPFSWEYQNITIDEQLITAHGEIKNSFIEGLSSYTVKDANYEILRSTLVIDMLCSKVKGHLSYDLNTTVMNQYPVYGAGDVSFELENFRFSTNVKVSFSLGSKKISISGFSNTKVALEKLTNFEITGLFNDEELSKELGPVIMQMAPKVLVNFQEEITSQLNIIMLKQSKIILEKIDIWEFIHWW